jgi:sugar phosphate isomerase/epimerase
VSAGFGPRSARSACDNFAMVASDSRLVLNYFSLGRTHPLDDRLAAAAAAGFDSIGLYVGEYQRLVDSDCLTRDLLEPLSEHGLWVSEIEVLRGWADVGLDDPAYAATEARVWEMADVLGCRYVQAIGPYSGSITDAGRRFAALCDRAADHGLVVGLEFLPFTNILTVDDARRIVEEAGRPNGGLCMDIWHFTRGASTAEMLAAVPGELVTGIQMNDGTLVPEHADYYEDCLWNRRAPGEGEFDVDFFVSTLVANGAAVPWGMEVCDRNTWGKPGLEHVQRIADGMRAALARVAA